MKHRSKQEIVFLYLGIALIVGGFLCNEFLLAAVFRVVL